MNVGQAANVLHLTGQNGGGTFDKDGVLQRFDQGYMVGGIVPSHVIAPSPNLWPSDYVEAIRTFAREHRALLSQDFYYLGTWKDEVGRLHLDISEHLADRHDAIIKGMGRNELAIWDNAASTEVMLLAYRQAVIDFDRAQN